jgi:glycosyltransferase involved in cell wall biosynthesis
LFLEKCLQSITQIIADKKMYEIIIVNNNCTDKTQEVCDEFFHKYSDIQTVYTTENHQGLGFARNKGISIAKGQIIAFIDDDAEVTSDFVNEIIAAFKNHPEYNAMGGKILPVFEGGETPVWFNKYLKGPVSMVNYGDTACEFPSKFPFGCNMIFRSCVFERYGGFNGMLNRSDDKDMFLRLKKANEKVWYEPKIVVYHNISKDRMTFEAIKNIGFSGGKFETIRLKDSSWFKKTKKGLELLIKYNFALLVSTIYVLRGQKEKGIYLSSYMYNMLVGYVKSK